MTIWHEVNAFCLEQRALAAPAWGCAAFAVDYTMAGQML